MKTIAPLLFLFCTILTANVIAQGYQPEDLVKFKQDTTSRVYISKIKSNQVYIPLDFNSSEIKDLSAYREIKYYSILKVELVYSAYQKSDLFNQPALNIERLKALKDAAPELFTNSLTRWRFIAQTDCKDEHDARELFHGFIITYRPEMISAYSGDQFKSISYTVEKYVNPNYDKMVHAASYGRMTDEAPIPSAPPIDIKDSAVLTALKRNKDWKDVAIVCDVTGSMVPYITQTLIWFKLNCKATTARNYTFFNDGDDTPDDKKVIGATGGVYVGKAAIYDSIESNMFRVMQKGSGGDSPENNIEALIKTIHDNPNCKELVMIADNLANVKDISLLYKVTKPVHVILCGTQSGINVDYLNIARATGGSINTIEKDITDLAKINEGEYFEFKGQKFKLESGRFKLVYDM